MSIAFDGMEITSADPHRQWWEGRIGDVDVELCLVTPLTARMFELEVARGTNPPAPAGYRSIREPVRLKPSAGESIGFCNVMLDDVRNNVIQQEVKLLIRQAGKVRCFIKAGRDGAFDVQAIGSLVESIKIEEEAGEDKKLY